MSLADQLHDEVDTIEEIQERAAALVEEARALLREALVAGASEKALLGAAVIFIGDGITDATTEAFREAATWARKRREA
jgi:hypothetical protein